MKRIENYISVDVETAGPTPDQYSLLSIGACPVFEPAATFYVEIQPVHTSFSPEALKISGLNMDELKEGGLPPQQAMQVFADWLNSVAPDGGRVVFVAFNAPFDWMFVSEYFQRYLGRNPFGHSALDMKAFYMGLTGVPWSETGFAAASRHYNFQRTLTHNALQDAIDQAELFRRMLGDHRNQLNVPGEY